MESYVVTLTDVRSLFFYNILFIGFAFNLMAQAALDIDSTFGLGYQEAVIQLKYSNQYGIIITDPEEDGIWVHHPGDFGYTVTGAGNDGVRVLNSVENGIRINNSGSYGMRVAHSGASGIIIDGADQDGIFIEDVDDDGIQISHAGDNGLLIIEAEGDGVSVISAKDFSLNIKGFKNMAAGRPGHIAQIVNDNTGDHPDVLALKVGKQQNVGSGSNFITFYDGDDTALGSIEGNGFNGVVYNTTGADFAECFGILSENEALEIGDVVGVFPGGVSKQTIGASHILVVSERPALLGNKPIDDQPFEKIGLIGQIRVKVRGSVQAGDWIVPSGFQDGTAIAISSTDMDLEHPIIGKALENKSSPALGLVNTMLGMDHSGAKDAIIRKLQQKIEVQEKKLKDIEDQLIRLNQLLLTAEN